MSIAIYEVKCHILNEATMRVSRVQADEHRRTVIEVASRLFRENGFDGVGLKTLMKGAGLTQGGFYKQFRSKDDLAARALRKALEDGIAKWSQVTATTKSNPLSALMRFYLSDRHRDTKGEGCALAALGPDVARHSPALRRVFETGIKMHLGILDTLVAPSKGETAHNKSIATLSTMVGALLLSRAVNDKALSERFLRAAEEAVQTDVDG
jgi:TetR/AcrR family transcriptional regulator, transcriptional repressor for nem operon